MCYNNYVLLSSRFLEAWPFKCHIFLHRNIKEILDVLNIIMKLNIDSTKLD